MAELPGKPQKIRPSTTAAKQINKFKEALKKRELEKGKPLEKVGRKVTDLSLYRKIRWPNYRAKSEPSKNSEEQHRKNGGKVVERKRILNQIGVIFVTCLLILLSSQLVYAACTGASPTWMTTPDYASVSSCIAAASSGDTINVSAGSATWTSQLSIKKNVHLIGPGKDNLTITHGYAGALINITLTSDVTVRISGIYFTQSTNRNGYSTIQVNGKTDGSFAYTKVRIDNNKFEKGTRAVTVNGWVEGLIDNNTFVNCNIAVGVNGDNTYSWNRPIVAGTKYALFVEDNTFIVNNSTDQEPNEQVYLQEGARTVVRYNTFDGSTYTNGNSFFFDSHGNWGTVSGTPQYRGQPITEVYNNKMTGHHSYGPMDFRGGSLLWHHNAVTLLTSYLPNMSMREEEAWTSGGPFCYSSCPVFTQWASWDNITNSFFWENTFNGVSLTEVNYTTYMWLKDPATEATFIKKDRDYFIHAPAAAGGKSTYPTVPGKYDMTFSSDGANAYYPYVPYTYPHPLRGSNPTQYALSVTSANGIVTSNPTGINCGSTCSATYDPATLVTLNAIENSGYTFTGWSGACSGTGTCVVTMDAAKSITANYATTQFNLTVVKSGAGTGTVNGTDGLINCGNTCSVNYDSGRVVTLTASANGSTFAGWSGACSGTGACTVSMTEAKTVTATFIPVYSLTVTKSIAGAGAVASSDGTINCGSTCSATYDPATTVILAAAANSGYSFTGWLGACSGTGTCTVTMDAAKSVTAQFATAVNNLTVAKSGTATGTVTGSDGLINCGSTCSVNYETGKSVTLTARPVNSWATFSGWSGACTGTGTCTVSMTAAKTAVATFNTKTKVRR